MGKRGGGVEDGQEKEGKQAEREKERERETTGRMTRSERMRVRKTVRWQQNRRNRLSELV